MIQSKEVQYAKEVDDVLVLFVQLIGDIKGGKSAGDIMSGAVSKLIDAVAGVDQVQGELQSSRAVVLETIGFRVGQLTDALLG